MVGVPALDWWRCGPSSRICWPTFSEDSFWMTIGPSQKEITSAVSPASSVRNVM